MNETVEVTTPSNAVSAPFDLAEVAARHPWLAEELAKLPPDQWISALGGEMFIAH